MGDNIIGALIGFINFAVIVNSILFSFFELFDSGIASPAIENPKIVPFLLLCNWKLLASLLPPETPSISKKIFGSILN